MGKNIIKLNFWKNKRVLITGHSGFKGAWLTYWLNRLGANITGVSLPPVTSPNLYELIEIEKICKGNFCDVNNYENFYEIVKKFQPEIVFHLAAQPLVKLSYQDPVKTFQTNLMGVVNILDILKLIKSARATVIITTDKVYQNTNSYWQFRENDILGGHDPYSASKAASEIIIDSYRNSFFSEQGMAIASARSGNVIGGGDWSEYRIIPDAVKAWLRNETLLIRNPNSIRPWQHVLEPLAGYISLAEKIYIQPEYAGAYNFGPDSNQNVTVEELIYIANQVFKTGNVAHNFEQKNQYESAVLALDNSKAKVMLGVKPKWTLKEAVDSTMNWYLKQSKGKNPKLLCDFDINNYEVLM